MKYDLEQRTLNFAKEVRKELKTIKKGIMNLDDIKQLLRVSSSVGANYIEANESLSKKDLLMRLKIARKEAKETIYWLDILDLSKGKLRTEAIEIKSILSSIISKIEN